MRIFLVYFLLIITGTVWSISVSSVNVTSYSDSTTPNGNIIWRGSLSYTIDEAAWIWVELSRDNGATWNQRYIQATGAIGLTTAGSGKTIRWMADGNQGCQCKIRVRANTTPYTYSNDDADNNKYPFPLPGETYANVERLIDTADHFPFASYSLPPADFSIKISSGGQFLAGFAKAPIVQDWANPINDHYFTVGYFESADGQDKFIVMQSQMIYVHADWKEAWEDSILLWYGIPHDHFYWGYDHMHSAYEIPHPEMIKPLIDSAIANKEPMNIGWLNYALPTGIVHNRQARGEIDRDSYKSLFALGASAGCDGLEWEINGQDTIGVHVVNSGEGKPRQRLFDCPTDSWMQMMIFKNNQGVYKGVFLKITGHPDQTSHQMMDSLGLWMGGTEGPDGSYTRIYNGPIVIRFIGFGGNQVELFRGYGDGTTYNVGDSWRTMQQFSKVVKPVMQDSLPEMAFAPLTAMGVVQDHNLYGVSASGSAEQIGTDPARMGIGIQVLRFNDMYLTSAPGEAPAQMGMYIRARALDKKVMYNAYCNTALSYFAWGMRYNNAYETGSGITQEGSFNMAQDIIRGINILEISE